jgi:ABC-type polar amino acid transport system ATPase subunit
VHFSGGKTQEMINVNGLVKHHGRLLVLDQVSVAVQAGEVAAVIGPSGSGKSTLLRCLNGLETFDRGRVQVEDICIEANGGAATPSASLRRLRRHVGMVFQQFHLFPHMSVLDNVLTGPVYVLKEKRRAAEPFARKLLERVGLGDRLRARPDQLSGGQQQRVAIARALAVRPKAILFDEPTSALDPRMASEVFQVIAELAKNGQTMIVVTHSLAFARRIAHTVHVMDEGRIVESGSADQVFGSPRLETTQTFLSQVEGS